MDTQNFPGSGSSFFPSGAGLNPPAAGASLAVIASVQQVTLPQVLTQSGSVRIAVSGSQPIAFAYGTAAGLTMANGIVMLPNTVETFYLPVGTSMLSMIGAAAGSTAYVSVGNGQ